MSRTRKRLLEGVLLEVVAFLRPEVFRPDVALGDDLVDNGVKVFLGHANLPNAESSAGRERKEPCKTESLR